MKKTDSEILDYYVEVAVQMISDKYKYNLMEALRQFYQSETYAMLIDEELEMWDFGPPALFDMWECEKVTGNPCTSQYLRSEINE